MNSTSNISDGICVERRVDGPEDAVDQGVVIAATDGVGPALEHMVDNGVERATALRVLAGPEFHRKISFDYYFFLRAKTRKLA